MKVTIANIRRADKSSTKTRIFVGVLPNRLNEATRSNIKELRDAITPAIVDKMDLDANTDIKLKWSKHAGCTMCPCSPGFIVESDAIKGTNMWVDVTE